MNLAHSAVSPSRTPYPATPFPHINDNVSDTGEEEDTVYL